MSLLSKESHHQVYYLGLCLLIAGIPLSRFAMSVAQFVLLGNWLLEGNLKRKIRDFFHQPLPLVFSSLYLLHVIGLAYSIDYQYAVKDLRIKVPLLLLPLILSTSEGLSKKRFLGILKVYVLAVLAGTLIGIYLLIFKQVNDLRDMSPFVSHIRFSLSLCLAIGATTYLLTREKGKTSFGKVLALGMILVWFVLYMFIAQLFTGIIIFVFLAWIWLIYWGVTRKNRTVKVGILLTSLLIPTVLVLYFRNEYNQYFLKRSESSIPETVTSYGNPYFHDTTRREVISGNRIWLNVCPVELQTAWEKRSQIQYDSLGKTGLKIADVLLRYLTSKGLKKDAGGVASLKNKEIRLIENGVADVEETRGSAVHQRLRKIFFEYQNYRYTGDASGHSVMMRLEYWKASLGIIRQHWLLGVGTGDMNLAFQQYYEKTRTKLLPEWRRRSHNQFLSITVGFGVPGLLWFLFAWLYPSLKQKKFSPFLFTTFLIILFLSMLTEDTIESQDGVTFAAFFYSLLLFVPVRKSP